jgi:hypothetical protein
MAHTIVPPVNVEAMEMRVGPPEGDLERIVEIHDRAVIANQQPTTDHGADASQKDAQLVGNWGCGRHR